MELDYALIDEQSNAWARFFGTHLPRRVLDLRFDLPVPHRRPEKNAVSLGRTRERYRANAHNRLAQLTDVTEHFRSLNRSRLPPQLRFDLAEIAVAAVTATGRELIAELLAEPGGVPELEGRRERLETLIGALAALLVAYQAVLDAAYRRGPFWYQRSRRRVHLSAHRILELIVSIQQVRALRYQRLEGACWQTANTVFRVMLDYEQIDVPLETLGSLLRPRRRGEQRSLSDLYAALQVPWILDFLSWPETLMPFALDYCRSICDATVFRSEEEAALLERPPAAPDYAWTRCYRARQPDAEHGSDSEGPALAIDYAVLIAQTRADFLELCKAREARNPFLLPRRLAQLAPTLQLSAGHLVVHIAERGHEPELPVAKTRERDLRIHSGFAEVFAHLLAIFDRDGRLAARRELSDLFAQRSATIGEDHTAAHESRWYVVREAPGRLRLQTQETRFTHRMSIGTFLAFGHGEAGIRAPSLGKVTRIFRPDSGVVQVDIMSFAEYARPVGVKRASAADGASAAPEEAARALLTYGERDGWCLLLPEQERFWEHTVVVIQDGGRETRTELAELRDLGENYCLFRLMARQDAQRKPRYPSPPSESLPGNAQADPALASPPSARATFAP